MHKTHFKKDGSGYCDPRAAWIVAYVQARKAALEQGDSVESVNMNELYIEVAGTQKNKIFGTGEIGSSYKTIVTSTEVNSENEELRRKVATLTTELEEERAARAAFAENERAARDALAENERVAREEMERRITEAMEARMREFTEQLR